MRPAECFIFLSTAQWTALNPIIPVNVFAVDTDTGGIKLGDGATAWLSLETSGSAYIVNKAVQTSRNPIDEEMLEFCSTEDKWIFKLRGCLLTETNFVGASATVYPKYALIIETDDSTGIPTGRFKIGDGVTQLSSLPWSGPISITNLVPEGFPVGSGIEYDGTGFVAQEFVHADELQEAAVPSGKFHRDDGTWAVIDTLQDLTDIYSTAGAFVTLYVGGKSGEALTVTLTSDGTSLFIDGNEVWTSYNDGPGSGLDADTVDGFHASQIVSGVMGPLTSVVGNISTFGNTTGTEIDDSGESISDLKDYALFMSLIFGD